MNIKITPSKLNGHLRAISSKSDAHRVIIAAALSNAVTKIHLYALSEDIEATIRCIKAIGSGVLIAKQDDGITITVTPAKSFPRSAVLDCGESGSTARFLLPVAAHLCGSVTLTGHGRLPKRPFLPLTDLLRQHGCEIDRDFLPLQARGSLLPGTYQIEGNISSQFISGLLFVLPLLPGDSEIILLSPLESEGYADMTVRTLLRFGVRVEKTSRGFFVPGFQTYNSPNELRIEGDWSNSAFWIGAGVLGGDVTLSGLDPLSLQGDRQICGLAAQFGGQILPEGTVLRAKSRSLRAIEIDAGNIPDLVPILAVIGSVAAGRTVIRNASRLRLKESDRLEAIAAGLTNIGADISQTGDGLIINGKSRLSGGTADSCHDHRIAMALAVASAVCEREVIITNARAVEKSYPGFFEDFKRIGGNYCVLSLRQ